jgi:peroxiredoxin/YHS domain-containing protein
MKTSFSIWGLITLLVSAQPGRAQDAPTEIAKKDLPKMAFCLMCMQQGETAQEKPAAGVKYKGKTYYFCNKGEVATFRKDSEWWLPLELPLDLPDFALKTVADTEIKRVEYKDKVLLLDFWATWCKPCVETMPELQKLSDKYGAQGLAVLGVSTDEKGAKAVKPFAAKKKFTYTLAMDGTEKPLWYTLKVRSIPALFLVGRDGKIVRQWSGKPDKKQLETAIQEALKAEVKPSDPPAATR